MRQRSALVIPVLLVLIARLRSGALAGDVVINEINYQPESPTSHEEFVEITNTGQAAVDLSGWFFSSGIDYTFPASTLLQPGGFLVVALDPAALKKRFQVDALGPFQGSLSSNGERLTLRSAAGDVENQVQYGVSFPWPSASAGDGSSMELINPSLDNGLGGSWRPSGWADQPSGERSYYLDAEDPDWHYRPGTSEASTPVTAWRAGDFVEDATWLTGQASFGFADGDDKTVLSDMKGGYTTVYLRHAFTIAAGGIPSFLGLGIYTGNGAIAWINGVEVARVGFSGKGEIAYNGVTVRDVKAAWQEFLIKGARAFLKEGANVLAIQAVNRSINSLDFSIDARLFAPGAEDQVPFTPVPPTPGRINSVFSENAPPQVRQVHHESDQPASGRSNTITAKVTDPDGVGSVQLHYQVVVPGRYVPAYLPVPLAQLITNGNAPLPPNPAFEDPATWTTVDMTDDGTGADEKAGDGVYSASIPGFPNRTLIRYRISATDSRGASVRVPLADDPSLNFSYLVYDGVPDYQADTSINGKATTYPADQLTTMAVYFFITRVEDLRQCIAAADADQIPQGTLARFAENWEGTWIYEGVVYDHIRYRLRGANGRYQIPPTNPAGVAGKRNFRFKFNKGHPLLARDRFGSLFSTGWSRLSTCRMFGNRLDGNWGLNEQVNDIIWGAYDVPAPRDHPFHWRVITGAEEAPAGAGGQYLGDFWGLAWAMENYDGDFLDARGLPKGNLYKLVNQTTDPLQQERYQAPYAVSNGADHNNIQNSLLPSQPDAWLNAYVDYDEWYRYHAICEAVRNYDYWPEADKNAAWYFEPIYLPENRSYGKMATFAFDTDATWGPTWNQGIDRPYAAIQSRPAYMRAYRNVIREVRDLLFQRDQLEPVIRQTAAFLQPLEKPDIDRWRNATPSAGRQYFAAAGQATLEGKIADMLKFAFTGGTWDGGGVGAGGQAAFLDSFGDGTDKKNLPAAPTVTYTGAPGYPQDGLTFRSSDFSDPQGEATFAAMKWRIGRVSPLPGAAGSIPLTDPFWKTTPIHLEIEALWDSGEIAPFAPDVTIPRTVVEPGATYRVRVKVEDVTGLWSHWSSPVEFTAGPPAAPVPEVEDLRITEVMYNAPGGSDFEFIEIANKGVEQLDLREVAISGAVEFAFRDGAVTALGSGEYVVVVANLEVFRHRYDVTGMRIAGEYSGNLSNSGERIVLTHGLTEVLDFAYDDGWYPTTDGEGASLTIRDIRTPKEQWGDAASWAPSTVYFGTPGRPDPGFGGPGLIRPGDLNADGSLDLSDPVALLGALFLGAAASLPCGEGLSSPGNLRLLDATGDGSVDITDVIRLLEHLFLGGPPHVLGEDCAPIQGCPEACRG